MKSKALFILPPYSSRLELFKVYSWKITRIPPVGLITIASYLQEKGHDVKLIDSHNLIVKYGRAEYLRHILKIVDEFKPDIIGINILTAAFDEAKKISCALKKKFPDRTIIVGGTHPSVEPILTLKQIQDIDAICIGPGEEVCLAILDGNKISDIPGLMHRDHVEKFKKRPVEMDIDKYPFLNYALFNRDFYADFTINTTNGWAYKSLGTLTSRSCPYSCKFCASTWSKPARFHSPEYVIEMAKYLSTYDIDVISFLDDTIAGIKDRLQKICEGFILSRLFWPHHGLRWFSNMRANQIEPGILKLMKKAGCFGVGIGIESGSDRMLQVMNKQTTVEMNKRACAYVKEAGLSLCASFMIGIPGETESEMNETLAFIKNLNCNSKRVGSFRPLPGSPFYNEFIKNNILKKENIDWSNLGSFSSEPKHLFCHVSKERFEKIYREALAITYSNPWVAVHEDTLLKRPQEIRSIACRTKVKISKSDNYDLSALIPYRPPFVLISHLLYSILHIFLPLKLRQQMKVLLNKFTKKDYFKE